MTTPSRKTRGVIAAGDPQTAGAGAKLLHAGGNAIDAAVASAFAAFVCELPLCSPLGGAVMVLEEAGGRSVAFDMFARTPGLGARSSAGAARDFEAVSVSFGAASQIFHAGRASVALPLTLRGLIDVHRRYGALSLDAVLEPAIDLGRNGWVLGPGVAYVFEILVPIVGRTPDCFALFADPDASGAPRIARAGARLENHALADTLDRIRKDPARGVDAIYAQLAHEFGPERGGLITLEDARDEAVAELDPIVTHHATKDAGGPWRLATMPSPSTGGLLVALGLRMLEGSAAGSGDGHSFLSREHAIFMAKVQEALLAERDETFIERCADPDAVRAMLADEHVQKARKIARDNLLGSTTHISAIDEDGNAVALTLTNGEGSGHVLSGTGMLTNNLLGEEDLHPRGFHRDPPGKPLTTMMAPTILSRTGARRDLIALGSGGSNRLRTAILQVLDGLVEHRVPPVDAVFAPRLHVEIDPTSKQPRVAFESTGRAEDVTRALERAYPQNPAVFGERNLYFGGVHLATYVDGVFEGVGDTRRGGARSLVT